MKQSRWQHDLMLRGIKAISVVLTVGAFAGCWYGYYGKEIVSPFFAKGDVAVILIYTILFLVFSQVYDAFQISMVRVGEVAYSQILAIGLSDLVIYIIICLLSKKMPWLIPGLLCFFAQALFAILWAYMANRMYYSLFQAKKTLIIHDVREGMDRLIEEYNLAKKFDVVKVIDVQECLDDLSVLDEVEVVFFSGIHSHERNIILKKCVENDIRSFVIPRIGDVIMSSARRMHMFHLPVLRVERYHPSLEFLAIKRAMDILVSAFALVVLSPIMLATSIAIKATDGGPILYKQNRLTKDGKVFKVMKFRSMRVDAEKDGVARLSTGDKDDRITPVGRFIRKVRIDELPQLINILKGDMSLIGPRPERPEIAAQYEKEMPEFRLRLQAKAGLTGYAQIYGKYNTTPYDKLQMDLMYIANPSLFEELSILLATVKILFLPESTEGIAEGQTTALEGSGVKKGKA